MKENNNYEFKDVANSIVQIGTYLMNIDISQFLDTDLNRNIIKLLFQVSLFLEEKLDDKSTSISCNSKDNGSSQEEFISKSEAISRYHPLITQYGLTQAINKNEVKYIKRGNKYFFNIIELKEWIDNQHVQCSKDSCNKTIEFV